MTGFTTSYGVKLPWIIYGTAWKKEQTKDLVIEALKAGFNGIDTACQPKHYNEGMVGDAITSFKEHGLKREDIYIQTKFTPLAGQDTTSIPYDKNALIFDQVLQSFEKSKENLKTNYTDTLIMHSPVFPHSLFMEAWSAMEKIYRRGGARQLGISNCYETKTLERLYKDATVKPAVLQNRFYQESGYDVELRNFCSKSKILYQSFWTLTANGHILNSYLIKDIAKKYDKTKPQIFFRYLNQSGILPLTGTCSVQHMKEDLQVLEFELSKEELTAIDSILF
ncbi:MAG: aldo/keto reductase [Deltaproteobacteria bacterium]|nr:aldo/keto reductase [Deltaproteobacteria bacterium]